MRFLEKFKKGSVSLSTVIVAAMVITFGAVATNRLVFHGQETTAKSETVFQQTSETVQYGINRPSDPGPEGGSNPSNNPGQGICYGTGRLMTYYDDYYIMHGSVSFDESGEPEYAKFSESCLVVDLSDISEGYTAQYMGDFVDVPADVVVDSHMPMYYGFGLDELYDYGAEWLWGEDVVTYPSDNGSGYAVLFGMGALYISEPNVSFYGITFPQKGFYFATDESNDLWIIGLNIAPLLQEKLFAYLTDENELYFEYDDVIPKKGDTYSYDQVVDVFTDFADKKFTSPWQVPWYKYREDINVVYTGGNAMYDGYKKPINLDYWFYGLSNASYIDVYGFAEIASLNYAFYDVGTKVNTTISDIAKIKGDTPMKNVTNRDFYDKTNNTKYEAGSFPKDNLKRVSIQTEAFADSACAIYSETDNSLRFYNNQTYPQEGTLYNNLIVTAKWCGVDKAEYTKAPWSNYASKIKRVYFEDVVKPFSTSYWFADFVNVDEFDFSNLDTSTTQSVEAMFKNAGINSSKISKIDLSNLDFGSVIYYYGMFHGVGHGGNEIIISMPNNMEKIATDSLFSRVWMNLEDKDGYDPNVASGYDFSNMQFTNSIIFKIYTSADKTLRIYHNTDVVKEKDTYRGYYVDSMIHTTFKWSSTWVDIVEHAICMETVTPTSMRYWFSDMDRLKSVDLSNIDSSQLTAIDHLFDGAYKLKEVIGIENLDVSRVTDFSNIFGSYELTYLDLSRWDMSSAKKSVWMFHGSYFEELKLPSNIPVFTENGNNSFFTGTVYDVDTGEAYTSRTFPYENSRQITITGKRPN